jgi:hypothetical protein
MLREETGRARWACSHIAAQDHAALGANAHGGALPDDIMPAEEK